MSSSDNFVDKNVIGGTANATLLQTYVKGILQQILVVGADIDRYWKTNRRIDPCASRVQSKFSDRNTHSGRTKITEPENPFTIGHDNDPDILMGPIFQHARDAAGVPDRNKETAWAAENVPIFLAGTADGRRVDNRHQLLEMVKENTVKERFVPILKRDHEDVAFQVRRFRAQTLECPGDLFLLRTNARREQPSKPESIPFLFSKRNPLVQNGIVKQVDARYNK